MKEDRKLFRECLDKVMKNEGVYSNDPKDRGGMTMYGVTQKVYDEFRTGIELEVRPVTEMDGQELEDIYYSYWNTCHCSLIAYPSVAYYLFDCAVNMGSMRASKLLQKALKALGIDITIDGCIGSQTLKRMISIDPELLLKHFKIQREMFYRKIVEKDASQEKFLNGWLNRCKVV